MKAFTIIYLIIGFSCLQRTIAQDSNEKSSQSSSMADMTYSTESERAKHGQTSSSTSSSSSSSSSESTSSSSESSSKSSESEDKSDEEFSVRDKLRDLIHKGAERFKTRLENFRKIRNGIEDIFLGEK